MGKRIEAIELQLISVSCGSASYGHPWEFQGSEKQSERWDSRENICYEAEHAGQVVCADGMEDVSLLGGALDSLE
jgi:hypothetical protein